MQAAEPSWTLEELTAQVALALGVDGPRQESGRVRDVPDRRTIRYYGTLGLIDPPAGFRGRTALYHRRHLWQLVAIKRLQARGLTLTEVQQRLLGLSDVRLRQLADVPEDRPDSPPNAATAEEEPFWKTEPAPETASRTLTAVPLAPGVTLLVEGVAPLDDHDLAALRASAAPLLKLLNQRRMDRNPTEESA